MAKNDFDCTSLTPEQRDARLALDVERLLRCGRKHKLIKELDELVARNTLLDLLQLAAPSETKPPKEDPATPAALLDALNSGKVKAAGLDVWMSEKDPNWALASHPAVSCTPHIGAATVEAQKRIGTEIVDIIRSF